MPFGWTVNPFRGCEMGCHYCYARYTHEFLGHNDPATFERRIYVKLSDRESLRRQLVRAARSGSLVALGAARDVPGLRLSITTKSTLVARDAALLGELATRGELSVNFSIVTVDAALARRLEPRAP